jgi:MFS family permease
MGIVGLFCSPYHPASNALISHAIREKGRVFGIHGIAGSLGVALVPVISAWIGTHMGWRGPHILYGIMGIGIGCYSLTIPRQSVRKKVPGQTGKEVEAEQRISMLNLVIFFVSAMALGLTYKGIMTFLPAYMGESVRLFGMTVNKVTLGGTVATVALLSGAVGQYLAGRLVDRFSAEKLYFGSVVIGTVCVFIMAASTDMILIAASISYAFFYFATQPIQNYLLSRYFPRHRQGLGFGIHFFVTFGIGSTAAAVSGYLADRFGLVSVFHFMGFCFILSSIASWLLLWRTRPRPSAAPR